MKRPVLCLWHIKSNIVFCQFTTLQHLFEISNFSCIQTSYVGDDTTLQLTTEQVGLQSVVSGHDGDNFTQRCHIYLPEKRILLDTIRGL
jgi:hypothetical protein